MNTYKDDFANNMIRWYAKKAKDYIKIGDSMPVDPGKLLEYHMKRNNVTEEDLAERSGLSPRTISRYRGGNFKDIDGVIRVCVGLHLQPLFSVDFISKSGFNIESTRYAFQKYVCFCLYDKTIDEVNEIAKHV